VIRTKMNDLDLYLEVFHLYLVFAILSPVSVIGQG